MNNFRAFHPSQPEIEPLVPVGKPFVIHSQQMEQGRVQVIHVDRILSDVVAEIIGGSPGHPRLDPSPRKPHGEASWVVVSTSFRAIPITLARDTSAKLSPPDDQRVVQHTSLLQVRNQGSTGLIGIMTTGNTP